MLPLVRLSRLCAVSALVLLPLGGCLLDDDPPPVPNPTPKSCGNNTCEIANNEDCSNCPEDCDCCVAINAEGTAGGRAALSFPEAEGAPDGVMLALDDKSEITLSLGGTWFDRVPPTTRTPLMPDIRLHGTVSTSSAPQPNQCPETTGGTGGFEVRILEAGKWRLIGIWTAGANSFDLTCGGGTATRKIQIRGQPDARGQFDAVTPLTGACQTVQGAP